MQWFDITIIFTDILQAKFTLTTNGTFEPEDEKMVNQSVKKLISYDTEIRQSIIASIFTSTSEVIELDIESKHVTMYDPEFFS